MLLAAPAPVQVLVTGDASASDVSCTMPIQSGSTQLILCPTVIDGEALDVVGTTSFAVCTDLNDFESVAVAAADTFCTDGTVTCTRLLETAATTQFQIFVCPGSNNEFISHWSHAKVSVGSRLTQCLSMHVYQVSTTPGEHLCDFHHDREHLCNFHHDCCINDINDGDCDFNTVIYTVNTVTDITDTIDTVTDSVAYNVPHSIPYTVTTDSATDRHASDSAGRNASADGLATARRGGR
ncbi:MAG: hypothetical protein MHM6MM_001072 [Cercozoa sp. M6MM]